MNFIIYLFAVLKNVIYGSSIFFTSKLSQSTDVLDILALRFLMSFAVLFILKQFRIIKVNISFKDFSKKSPNRKIMMSLALAGLFEPVLYMLFETIGVSMSTNITVSVLLSLTPISSAICEIVFLKERTTPLKNIFLAIGIIGVIYIAVNTDTTSGADSVAGILFIVLAVITGSLFSVFSRKSSSGFNAMEITYFSCFMGTVVFNIVNVARHLYMGNISTYFMPYMNAENMIGFVFLAVLSTIVATSMNNFALARMQVTTMAAFGGLSTAVAIIEGIIWGGETLYPFHIIGMSLIFIRMVGMICLSSKSNGRWQKPSDIQHQ